MGAVASFVGDVVEGVGDVVGDVVEVAGDALETVGETVSNTVENALNDPIGTAARVAAVSTGNAWALPIINATETVANGGNLGDAFESGAISYAAASTGAFVGSEVGSVDIYGTNMNGAISAATAGATNAVIRGGDAATGAVSGLTNYGVNTGLRSGYNTITSDSGGTQTSDIDYSQGDVNLSSNSGNIYAAGNIIGYDDNGQPIFEPVYVTPNTTEGPNAGIGGSGAGGASENPVIDNGDGTSSIANADRKSTRLNSSHT